MKIKITEEISKTVDQWKSMKVSASDLKLVAELMLKFWTTDKSLSHDENVVLMFALICENRLCGGSIYRTMSDLYRSKHGLGLDGTPNVEAMNLSDPEEFVHRNKELMKGKT